MPRDERRYRTRRVIDRKIKRYIETFGTQLIDGHWYDSGMYWGVYFRDPSWRTLIHEQDQPHRLHKRPINHRRDVWPSFRHRMDWDAPKVSDWKDDDEVCFSFSSFVNDCSCSRCEYDREYGDPFEDPYDLLEWLVYSNRYEVFDDASDWEDVYE